MNVDLYAAQDDFVASAARYAAFIGGIGSGKSYAGCVRAMLAGLGSIGNERIPTPNLGVVTAPTYRMLHDATLRTFREVAAPFIADYSKSDGIVTLLNGSEVLFRSADNPETLRGPNATWWHGDEAALYDSTVWRIMIGRLRQFGRQGYAWITTTPKGRNWIYQEFVQKTRDDYAIFRAKTRENVFLHADFVAGLQGAYTGDFAAQELDGEFVAFEGLIYPDFQREIHVTKRLPQEYVYTIGGVDWGYANPGAILVAGVDGDGRIFVFEEAYQRQRRVEEWAVLAEQFTRTYHVDAFYCDSAEPDFIAAFRDIGVPALEAYKEVLAGIQVVKNRLAVQGDGKPRLSVAPTCVNTLAEFEQYQWMEHRDGIRDQPKKVNDHAMDALRYLVMGVEQNSAGMGEVHIPDEPYISGGVY